MKKTIQKRLLFSGSDRLPCNGARFLLSTFSTLALLPVLAGCNQEYEIVKHAARVETHYRDVEISSTSTEFKPVVKMVIMIDNSISMADEQGVLSKGIGSMLDSLAGMNVDFQIFTSSSLDNTSASQKNTHASEVQYLYQDDDGNWVKSPTAPPISAKKDHYRREINLLRTGISSTGVPLSLRLNMDASSVAALKTALIDTISSVGIQGSQDEAGLCTLGRILSEDQSNVIFNKGDRAAFLIISDTNDWSDPAQCTREKSNQKFVYKITQEPSTTKTETVAAAKDAQWFEYSAQYQQPNLPDTPESFTLKTDYLKSETYTVYSFYNEPLYTLKAGYAVPSYKLFSNYKRSYFNVSFKYDTTCIVDEQPEPCEKSGSRNQIFLDLQPGASSGACPAGLRDHVQNSILQSGQALSSCTYNYIVENASKNESFQAASFGNPATGNGNLACNAQLQARAQAIVPSGYQYVGCHYTYSETTGSQSRVFNPASYGNPPSGNGDLDCNNALSTYAGTQIPSGSVLRSCVYTYSLSSKSTNKAFSPASYGSPASGTGNLACNSELVAYAKTLVPAAGTYASCYYRYASSYATITKSFAGSDYGVASGGTGNQSCNNQLKTYAQSLVSAAKPGTSYRNCSYTYTPVVPGGAGPKVSCSYKQDPADTAVNLCDGGGITAGTSTYANLDTYFKVTPAACGNQSVTQGTRVSCSRTGYKKTMTTPPPVESYVAQGSAVTLSVPQVLSPGAADLSSAILAKSRSLFGDKGFFISAIIHDNSFSQEACEGGYRASEGLIYKNLVSQLGSYGGLHPICSVDYGPALNAIREFIVRTSIQTYQIQLKEGERVDSITIRRGDQVLNPEQGQDYKVLAGTIEFEDNIILPGDIVSIRIAWEVKKSANVRSD